MLSISMADDRISYKKMKRNAQKPKPLILQCKFGSRAQKWPKIAKKRFTQSRFTQNFELVWYILGVTWWILMSRRFRICMAKGDRESARPSYGRPKLTLISREKKITLGGVAKTWQAAILTLEQNPPERKFLTYIKIFSQEDFALRSKLWPNNFS